MSRSLAHIAECSWKYLKKEKGFIRSFYPNYKRDYPILGDVVIADLHCHPNIGNEEQLRRILSIANKNKIGLLGYTFYPGSKKCLDYWQLKNLATQRIISKEDDKGLAFNTPYKVTIVGNYEVEGEDETLKKRGAWLHLLALMPNKNFEKYAKKIMPIKEFLDLSKEYNAISLIAHLCVLQTGKFIAYRSPDEWEIEYIKDNILPLFTGSDEVADSAFWMIFSWEQARKYLEENSKKVLRSSDAHIRWFPYLPHPIQKALKWYLLNEIGRAWTEFPHWSLKNKNGIQIRRELSDLIKQCKFIPRGEFTPAGQFVLGTALSNIVG